MRVRKPASTTRFHATFGAQALPLALAKLRGGAVGASQAVVVFIVFLLTASLSAAAHLPLVEAARNGDHKSVRSLLEQHSNVNAAEPDGSTALAWAANRDDIETAELLIRAGANVNAANEYGETALSLACANGNAVMVEKLLEAGANPNAARWTGETPLMIATRVGRIEAVKLLLALTVRVPASLKALAS